MKISPHAFFTWLKAMEKDATCGPGQGFATTVSDRHLAAVQPCQGVNSRMLVDRAIRAGPEANTDAPQSRSPITPARWLQGSEPTTIQVLLRRVSHEE